MVNKYLGPIPHNNTGLCIITTGWKATKYITTLPWSLVRRRSCRVFVQSHLCTCVWQACIKTSKKALHTSL